MVTLNLILITGSQEVQVSYNGNPCDTESLELNLVKTLAEATQDLSTDKKQNEISLFDRWNNDLEELVVAPSNEDQNTSSNSRNLDHFFSSLVKITMNIFHSYLIVRRSSGRKSIFAVLLNLNSILIKWNPLYLYLCFFLRFQCFCKVFIFLP